MRFQFKISANEKLVRSCRAAEPSSRTASLRVLHVADLHLRWFDWVRTKATAFDLLVIAGDLQDAFSDATMDRQARTCRDWLLSLKTPTIVVSGNHDYYSKSLRVSFDPSAEALWLRELGGQGNILAVDGQTVRFPRLGPALTISTIGWSQKPDWRSDTDVLVTHAPPCGIDVAMEQGGSRDLGDSELWRALREKTPPRLILAGHVHLARSYWSRWPTANSTVMSTILIPGCDESAAEPQRWEIDFATHRAQWFGEQEITIEV